MVAFETEGILDEVAEPEDVGTAAGGVDEASGKEADHFVEETVAFEFEGEKFGTGWLMNVDAADGAGDGDEVFAAFDFAPFAAVGGKSGEVVGAAKHVGSGFEKVHVERAMNVPGETGFKGIHEVGAPDTVMVNFAGGIEAGVEVGSGRFAGEDADADGEVGIERALPDLRGHGVFRDIDMGDLGAGMHAGIGATGPVDDNAVADDGDESGFDAVLNGLTARLGLPAAPGASVVGEGKFEFQALTVLGQQPGVGSGLGVEVILQDGDSGDLVDELFFFAGLLLVFETETAFGGFAAETFVDKDDGDFVGEVFAEFVSEFFDAFGGAAVMAVHAQGEADDDFGDALLLDDLSDLLFDGRAGVEGLEGMGEHAHVVAQGETDAHGAVIDAEGAAHGDKRAGLAQGVGQGFDEFFDFLGFATMGDEDGIGRGDDHQMFDSEHGDVLFAVGEDEVVAAVEMADFAILLVAVAVAEEVGTDRGPVADVIPVEAGFDVEHAGGFFHEGVVDGKFGEIGELGLDGGAEVAATGEGVDEGGKFGAQGGEIVADGFNAPEKHAGVPGETALFQETLGEVGAGFFAEAQNFENRIAVGCGGGVGIAAFDVAVAGAGPGGFDADGDEGLAFLGGGAGGAKGVLESFAVLDDVVGGQHHHGGAGVAGGHPTDGKGDGGACVAFVGFGDDVFDREIFEDGADAVELLMVGEDQDVFFGNETFKAVDGVLQKGLVVEQAEQLFGAFVAAQGPKSLAAAAGEDECVDGFAGAGFGGCHEEELM